MTKHSGTHPIIMTARAGNWRQFIGRKKNKKFQALQQEIFRRDDFTCQYCNFRSEQYQEVVNLDHNYKNNKRDNMVTSCSFCAQCFFLDSLTLDGRSGGTIIYLPELSQAQVNHFSRILFCAMDKETAYKSRLQALYLTFKERVKAVEFCFGPSSSDPRVFGQALIDAHLKERYLNHSLLSHLRLLPARHMFQKEVEYWKKTVYANIPL
ncbi:MAG: type IVB secretion system protein IcmJDotN [Pseudomonadota bacterium]